jgi:hypothetical protein
VPQNQRLAFLQNRESEGFFGKIEKLQHFLILHAAFPHPLLKRLIRFERGQDSLMRVTTVLLHPGFQDHGLVAVVPLQTVLVAKLQAERLG